MAILAMGGEGGGVLADWAVDMAEHCGYFAQTTSVPGVAQRTGTTVYYLEFFPQIEGETKEPVLSTMAAPGEVDIVIASELMESGRAVQRGFIAKDKTTLITSTHRVYSMTEKIALGDGRVDSEVLLESSRNAAKVFISGDFAKVAESAKSLISAALYGALAASGALPFEKIDFMASIERAGVGVANSIKAFEASFEIATEALSPKPKIASVDISIGLKPRDVSAGPAKLTPEEELAIINNPKSAVGFKLQELAGRIKAEFPEPVTLMLVNGIKRCADYQDVAYAGQYLDRLLSVRDAEAQHGNGTSRVLLEAARYTALWMTYEDTIRVADLKIRRTRFNRVGEEAQVQNDQIMQIREFLHPRSEEFADTLPTAAGRWLLRTKPVTGLIEKLSKNGIILQTTSIRGYIMLYFVARLKPIRRRSLRFNLEQERLDQWVHLINREIESNYDLAYEIAECANLIKGYGDTHENGWRNFTVVMEQVEELRSKPEAATRISELRKAALADEDGTKLRAILA
jgi:indolepyruvate ferredoxin oxidoreductase beta subunit